MTIRWCHEWMGVHELKHREMRGTTDGEVIYSNCMMMI